MKKEFVYCIDCGVARVVDTSKNNINKYRERYPKCNHCSKIGLVNTGQFKKGTKPWNKEVKGIHLSPTTEFKKGIHYSSKTEFKKGQMANEKNQNWKGNKVGYYSLHSWVQRKLGKASKCYICHTKNTKRYEWANISYEYKRDLSDWMELCVKCHRNYDRKNGWGLATIKYPELSKTI